MSKHLFLSCASREFSHIRDQITDDCRFPDVDVKSHEEVWDFNTGGTTLEKLDTYIAGCNAIVHLFGQAAGTEAEPAGIEALLRRHPDLPDRLPQITPLLAPYAPWRGSYTQWEAYLALYHRIPCHVFIATAKFERPTDFSFTAEETLHQDEHHLRLEKREQDRREFDSREELRVQVQRSLRKILPAGVVPFQGDISRIFKYAPAALIGREDELKLLNDTWAKVTRTEKGRPHILTFVALGGEGKTSLIAKWAAELAAQDWPGCDAAFAWSFYSQGTREQQAASSDLFLKEALSFFGNDADKQFAASSAGAFEKGQRLARLVGQRRSLLILDGIEPLQYAPTTPAPGELKDQGLAALLKGLATASHGLSVITTRYSLPDLKAFWQTTAPEVKLLRLSRDAGVHLLKILHVTGTAQEFAKLVEDVKGHALTLTLLGGFLKRAFRGDIRQRDRVKFEKADERIDGGHAFRTLAAYEQWLLSNGGVEGRREVTVLRLMGLFDRPADAGCLNALFQPPVIQGLTEPLVDLAEDDWEFCLTGLESAKLLTVNRDASAIPHSAFRLPHSLDAHPLLREYFAKQLREQNPGVWRAAHRRLYEHLCASTPEKSQPKLEDLQPLYQAVVHGCQAERHQEVMDEVYRARILRGNEFFSTNILGAFGQDLAALSCFFDEIWTKPNSGLDQDDAARVLSWVGFRLRALGRLSEALEPMSRSLEMLTAMQLLRNSAIAASNLSDLFLLLGQIPKSIEYARRGIRLVEESDAFLKIGVGVTLAHALHQAGERDEAARLFADAQALLRAQNLEARFLFGGQGQRYCELMLAQSERVAWQVTPSYQQNHVEYDVCRLSEPAVSAIELLLTCQSVSTTVWQTLAWRANATPLDLALSYLVLGRCSLYCAILESSARRRSSSSATPRVETERSRHEFSLARDRLEAAVSNLRQAGTLHHLPSALITRAWLQRFGDARNGPVRSQEDLDEAWEIAERGPMWLHMADIHLYRARLFFREKEYPWREGKNVNGEFVTNRTAADDLAAAETLITNCGYHRRDEELADAKRAILGTP